MVYKNAIHAAQPVCEKHASNATHASASASTSHAQTSCGIQATTWQAIQNRSWCRHCGGHVGGRHGRHRHRHVAEIVCTVWPKQVCMHQQPMPDTSQRAVC